MSRSSAIALAFGTICLAWGASYFAIRVALVWLPPFALGAIRYEIAGALLWIWCNSKQEARLTRRQWCQSALLGLCFVVVGNGTVLWAEQSVPSGITALLMAAAPTGTLLLEWGLRMRSRPSVLTWIGIMLGMMGVVLLAGHSGGGTVISWPVVVLLLGTLGWSIGSVLSFKLEQPASALRAIAAQMLVGAVIMGAMSFAGGERQNTHIANVSVASAIALAYLIFVASIAAYIAYRFLILNVSPTAAGVAAYVNPVVALGLGACFGEPVGGREVAALVLVLAGVSLVSVQELRRRGSKQEMEAIQSYEVRLAMVERRTDRELALMAKSCTDL